MNGKIGENTRANATIDALLSEFSQKPAEDRATILIRNYFEAAEQGTLSDEFTALFTAWLDDLHDRPAKDRAMERLIVVLEAELEEFENPGEEPLFGDRVR